VPLVLPNGARFSINGVWSGVRPIVTVWHALVTDRGNRTLAMVEAASTIGGFWGTHVVPNIADNYVMQTVSYIDLSSEQGSTGTWVMGAPATGGQGLATESPYNGIVVTKAITDKGRGRRGGRVFIPGIQATELDELGKISDAAQTAAESALTAFMMAVNGYSGTDVSAMQLVVAHTPSSLQTVTKQRRLPLKDGVMTSSQITGFNSAALVSGIRRRISGE
jgi:hypothetical protein